MAKRLYEVNANGNRRHSSSNAARVALVAAAWKEQGHDPKAWAVTRNDRDLVESREVKISTAKATAKALAAA